MDRAIAEFSATNPRHIEQGVDASKSAQAAVDGGGSRSLNSQVRRKKLTITAGRTNFLEEEFPMFRRPTRDEDASALLWGQFRGCGCDASWPGNKADFFSESAGSGRFHFGVEKGCGVRIDLRSFLA